MSMGITYRGRHSSEFGLVVRTNPSILPDFETNTIKIPGSHGNIPVGTEYEPKVIALEFGFVDKTIVGYSDRLRILADWLKPTDGVGEYIADHEPDKVYYAMLEEIAINRIETIARMGKGGLRFICYDPFAYGPESTYDLSDSVMIPNEGTAHTYPVFDLTVSEESTLISVTNHSNLDILGGGRSLILGSETRPDEEIQPRSTLILHDSMRSTSGWTGATEVDNGTVTGTMDSDLDGFYASDYGSEDDSLRNALSTIDTDINNRRANLTTQVNNKQKELDPLLKIPNPTTANKQRINTLRAEIKSLNDQRSALDSEKATRRVQALQGANYWVGPSLRRELPKECKSFIAEIEISNRNHTDSSGGLVGVSGIGIIEVYFRDLNNNLVCKLQFGDTTSNSALNHFVFTTDNSKTSPNRRTYNANNPSDWNNFNGVIKIMRDSGQFHPELRRYNNGTLVETKRYDAITPMVNGAWDVKNDIKSIQVAVRKYIGSARIYQRISEIKVWDAIGSFEEPIKKPVHKFIAGDRIHIDTGKGVMLLNGEPRTDLFHLGTDFFALVEGLNNLEVSNNVTGTVTFKNRYV